MYMPGLQLTLLFKNLSRESEPEAAPGCCTDRSRWGANGRYTYRSQGLFSLVINDNQKASPSVLSV